MPILSLNLNLNCRQCRSVYTMHQLRPSRVGYCVTHNNISILLTRTMEMLDCFLHEQSVSSDMSMQRSSQHSKEPKCDKHSNCCVNAFNKLYASVLKAVPNYATEPVDAIISNDCYGIVSSGNATAVASQSECINQQ
jgi:hypothetical protein